MARGAAVVVPEGGKMDEPTGRLLAAMACPSFVVAVAAAVAAAGSTSS